MLSPKGQAAPFCLADPSGRWMGEELTPSFVGEDVIVTGVDGDFCYAGCMFEKAWRVRSP